MKKLNINYILYAAAAIIILILIYRLQQGSITQIKERVTTDTILVPFKELKIVNAKPRIIKRSDTVYLTHAFEAALDTAIGKDTVKAEYLFPENLLSLELKRGADTIYKERIIYMNMPPEKRKWYEPYLFIAAGAAAGFLASELTGGGR